MRGRGADVHEPQAAFSFDPERLTADLGSIAADEWVAHFNKGIYEGDWSGVALRSVGGKAMQLYPDPTATERFADTETLGAVRITGKFWRPSSARYSARLLGSGPDRASPNTATTGWATRMARSGCTCPS